MSSFDAVELLTWMTDRLAEGMSLAREALRVVEAGGFEAEILCNAAVAPGADLRWGAGFPTPWPVLIDRISTGTASDLFVELPFRRAEDPPDDQLAGVVQFGAELYAYAPTSDRNAVATVLHSHDPATLYVALALETQDQLRTFQNPVEAVRLGVATIEMIVVGALDGEAFVVCTRSN